MAAGTAAEVIGILGMYGSVASAISAGRGRNVVLEMGGCVDRKTLIKGRMEFRCLIMSG